MHHDTPTTPRTDRVAVVVDTASRTGARALPLVSAALRRTAEEIVVHSAHGGLELLDALGTAMDDEPDLLVVGGGDGTIGCAAGLVAYTRTTLGVLPLGTANDVARTLEIPATLTAAVDTLLTGKVVDVDLGRVDGRAYLNWSSGRDGRATTCRSPDCCGPATSSSTIGCTTSPPAG